jgi:hypothetical protein
MKMREDEEVVEYGFAGIPHPRGGVGARHAYGVN